LPLTAGAALAAFEAALFSPRIEKEQAETNGGLTGSHHASPHGEPVDLGGEDVTAGELRFWVSSSLRE
jgi:hypothetical protein